MADERVLVLNDYSKFKATQHTRSSGKTRTTIEIHAEAVGIVVDDVVTGELIAKTIAELIRAGIRGTSVLVSDATRLYRQRAKAAFNRGESWTKKRYAGGKMGAIPPDPTSVRFGNDSGRLMRGVVARYAPAIASWVVNVPANRLTADQPGLRARMLAWLEPIVLAALGDEEIQVAVQKTLKGMVAKAGEAGRNLETSLLQALQQQLSSLGQLGNQLDELAEEPEPDRPKQ